jgi:hypothetical protein
MKNHEIKMLAGGRFISRHLGGTVYFDARHRVIKTRLTGGTWAELVQERLGDGSYRDQFLSIDGQIL